MLLRLDTFDWWPSEILECVLAVRKALLVTPCTDEVYDQEPFRSALVDLESHIRTQQIVGYHCTKEPEPDFFKDRGLRVLDRKNHQAEFLKNHAWRFTPKEVVQIRQEWDSYFPGQQENSRNGKIWFCLIPHPVVDGGADNLLTYFGGEAVYMPFRDGTPIAKKLSEIGNSVVVEAAITPDDLTTFTDNALAKNSFHLFHRYLNPEVVLSGYEGYISRDIPPQDIIQVRSRESFLSIHSNYVSS